MRSVPCTDKLRWYRALCALGDFLRGRFWLKGRDINENARRFHSLWSWFNMFRDMRRQKQTISAEECVELLKSETRGVLSMIGDDGYPYGVPTPQKWTRQHLDLGRLGLQSPEIQTSVCKSSSLWDFVIYRGLSEDTLTRRWRSIKKQLGHGNVSPSRYAVSLVYWTSRHFIDVLLLTGRSKVSSLGRGHWVKEIWVWNIETCALLWCQRI